MWSALSPHERLFWWFLGGAGVSLLLQFVPSWLNTDEHLGPARIFGGQQIPLTGTLILVGALADWACGDLTSTPRKAVTMFIIGPALLFAACLMTYSELGKLAGQTPGDGVIAFVSVLFSLNLLLAAYATYSFGLEAVLAGGAAVISTIAIVITRRERHADDQKPRRKKAHLAR
jgi:hypothetical protein